LLREVLDHRLHLPDDEAVGHLPDRARHLQRRLLVDEVAGDEVRDPPQGRGVADGERLLALRDPRLAQGPPQLARRGRGDLRQLRDLLAGQDSLAADEHFLEALRGAAELVDGLVGGLRLLLRDDSLDVDDRHRARPRVIRQPAREVAEVAAGARVASARALGAPVIGARVLGARATGARSTRARIAMRLTGLTRQRDRRVVRRAGVIRGRVLVRRVVRVGDGSGLGAGHPRLRARGIGPAHRSGPDRPRARRRACTRLAVTPAPVLRDLRLCLVLAHAGLTCTTSPAETVISSWGPAAPSGSTTSPALASRRTAVPISCVSPGRWTRTAEPRVTIASRASSASSPAGPLSSRRATGSRGCVTRDASSRSRSVSPDSRRTEVAFPSGSPPARKSSSVRVRLMPVPMTTDIPPSAATTRARMPQIFRPSTRTSLGHLSWAATPASARAARTASPVTIGSQPSDSGGVPAGMRTGSEHVSAAPAGTDHVRSRRPRPLV